MAWPAHGVLALLCLVLVCFLLPTTNLLTLFTAVCLAIMAGIHITVFLRDNQ